MKLKKISGLFSTVPTVLNTVPKQPYTFKGKVTRLDAPIGEGVPVILHDRVTGVCIETTETDADSFVVFQNLDKTKSYYIVAIDAENLFQSIVYDLTWQTSNNFEYNPKLQYTDKLAQSSLKDFYNYYQQESLLESDALVFSISTPSVYDDNILTWNASGSLVTDIIDDYPSFIFNASSRYLYLETTPTYAQQPFTFETFFQIDNLKASNTHYLFTQISTGTLRHSFYIDNQGYLIFSRDYSLVISIRSLSKIKDGWNHAALTFDGNNLYLFLNGKLESTNSDAIGLQGFQNHFGIGHLFSGAMAYTSWKHSCEYVTDFQPKTQSYSKKQFKDINDVFDSSVVLKTEVRSNSVQSLMVDKAKHMPFTVGATHLVQSNSAVSINNSFARSTVMSSDYVLKGDFCIELTYSLHSTVNYPTLFSNLSAPSEWVANNWGLTVNHSSSRNKYAIYRANLTTLVSTYPMLLREITTIAIDKQGTTVRVFFNGFLVDTFTNVPAFDTRLNSYIAFGREIAYTLYDAKLTNGISRYQSDYNPTWLSTWTDQNLAAEQHMLLNLSFKTSLVNFSTRLQAVLNDVSLNSTMSVNGTKSAFFKEAQLLLNSDFYVPREMFTFELRVYLSEQQEDFKTIVQLYRDASNILSIGCNANKQLCYILAEDEVVTLEDVVFKDNFDHLVIQRQGSIFKILFEGELVVTIPFSLVLSYVSLSVMSNFDRTNAAEGYVNNLYLYKNYLKYSDIYEVPYEEIVEDLKEKEPEVVVTPYTTSALNFENGLIDQIGTTVWQKEGTADITSVNKIFGVNSFETKALGDSLYTNSNVITGGVTPFTIEFHALLKNMNDYNALFSKNKNAPSGEQFMYIDGTDSLITYQKNNNGTWQREKSKNKVKLNEINKYTITYDSSALRVFLNDKLTNIVGLNVGLDTINYPLPFRLLSSYIPSYPNNRYPFNGIIDNINIHDGIATKVRDPDPYEEFLVVDLAFDGENNSTKIVDNTAWELAPITPLFYPFTDSLYNGTVSGTIQLLDNSSPFNDKSAYFNNSYILHNSSSDFNLTNKDFTIKCWVKLDSNRGNANQYPSIIAKRPSGTQWDWGLECNTTNGGSISFVYNNAQYVTIKSGLEFDTWMHVCVTCKNNKLYLFFNGELLNSVNLAAPISFSTANVLVGRTSTSWSDNYLKGNLSDLVFINGYCEHTETFTLPTEHLKNYNKWTVNGNAKISTDQKFDGFSSLYLNNGKITTSLVEPLGTFDFTINFDIIRMDDNNSNIFMWSRMLNIGNNSSPGGLYIARDSLSSNFLVDIYDNGYVRLFTTTDSPLSHNTKVNIKLIRSNGVFHLYINNILKFSNSQYTTYDISKSNVIIGGNDVNTEYLNGYIKNFKIYKGVAVTPEDPTGKIQLDFDNNLVDKYGNSTWTNNGVTFDQVNSVKGHAAYFNYNNSKLTCNSSLLDLTNSKGHITFDTKITNKNTNIGWDTLITSGNTDSLDRAAIAFSATSNILRHRVSVSLYNDVFFNYVTNTYYNINIIKDANISLVVINDCIVSSINSNLLNFNSSNQCTIGGALYNASEGFNGYIDNFKTIKNHQGPLLIDKPAIQLPLETNAINIGYAQLTVNSVGSPTYTTLDGKKCIRFESGKYLTINSDNIFNLGTNLDFYIECEFYINKWLSTSGPNNRVNILCTSDSDIFSIRINQENASLELRVANVNTVINSHSFSAGHFYTIKVFRKGAVLVTQVNNEPPESTAQEFNIQTGSQTINIGGTPVYGNTSVDGYMSNFKMFVGTSEIPETYNDKKVLDLDFKPTRKSYLFKDNNNKCIIHPVNITQRDYQDSEYCCYFNGTNQYLQLGKNDLFNIGNDDFVLSVKFKFQKKGQNLPLLTGGVTTNTDGYWYVQVRSETSATNPLNVEFVYRIDASNVYTIYCNQTLIENEVYEFTVVREGSTMIAYINDAPNFTVTDNRQPPSFNLNGNGNTYIGVNQYNSSDWIYKGYIYHVKFARNTSDINLLKDSIELVPVKAPPAQVNILVKEGTILNEGSYNLTYTGSSVDGAYFVGDLNIDVATGNPLTTFYTQPFVLDFVAIPTASAKRVVAQWSSNLRYTMYISQSQFSFTYYYTNSSSYATDTFTIPLNLSATETRFTFIVDAERRFRFYVNSVEVETSSPNYLQDSFFQAVNEIVKIGDTAFKIKQFRLYTDQAQFVELL